MSGPLPTVVTVEEAGADKYTQILHSGPHRLIADEPEDLGGQNRGPGPYEYLLMGLGACTNITVRMYANMKNIPLERIQVILSHRKVHLEDGKDCEKSSQKIDEIVRDITLEGELTGEQRQRLLKIANRCPVHQTLTSTVTIHTRLSSQ
ncbi:hypothetical protein Misp06_00602 [Microbulbifer sp. NBRC 101763]|uniref:OsmC family protein n=1 Tax=Microbulbifer TaxID=48073 RepID=UPI00038105A0|nr:OsmC family protein [Microbulbifer variabilis]